MMIKENQPVPEAQEGQNYMCPSLFFFSSGKSQWRGLGKRAVSLRNEQRLLWRREGGREKRWRESTKCCHWRGPRQLNQGATDFSLSETITPARTAWDFMKCFWTRIPDRSALHNSCFVNAGNRQPTERHSQKQCAQLLAFKKNIYLGQALNRQAYLYPSPCSLHQQKPGFHHRLINETFYPFTVLPTAFW